MTLAKSQQLQVGTPYFYSSHDEENDRKIIFYRNPDDSNSIVAKIYAHAGVVWREICVVPGDAIEIQPLGSSLLASRAEQRSSGVDTGQDPGNDKLKDLEEWQQDDYICRLLNEERFLKIKIISQPSDPFERIAKLVLFNPK